ncbi:hypothetical protein E2P81_ATG03222 [Venturia nashicola]|nr:hypothetical protein E2P81_ATG03222 [Venturia nashicola]
MARISKKMVPWLEALPPSKDDFADQGIGSWKYGRALRESKFKNIVNFMDSYLVKGDLWVVMESGRPQLD